MKPYYAVIAASKGYQPGLSAFLNSFREHHAGQGIKIVVCDCDLEPAFVEKYSGDDLTWVKVSSEKGHIYATKIHRFRVASELDGVVGVFDSDMYVVRSMLNFWKMAEAGFIVGGANGSNIRFGENWNEGYSMEVPDVYDTRTITSVPTFMDIERDGEVWRSIYEHKERTNAGADFNLLNIFLAKLDKLDRVIPIPSEQMTGVHHFQIKPDTRVINKAGELLTNNGLELFCVHGRYWEGNWYTNLLKPMPKHCARLGIRSSKSRAYQGAVQSRDILKAEFDRYCDWPYESSIKEATLANLKEQQELFFTESESLEEENAALVKKNETLLDGLRQQGRELRRLKKQLEIASQRPTHPDPEKPIERMP